MYRTGKFGSDSRRTQASRSKSGVMSIDPTVLSFLPFVEIDNDDQCDDGDSKQRNVLDKCMW
jgi:hypothetical protein